MTVLRRSGATIAVLVLVAGCAVTPPRPAMPPVLHLGNRTCSGLAAGLVTSALPLQSDGTAAATVDIGADAPCLQLKDGRPSLYHAFALPSSTLPMMARVASLRSETTLMASRIILLDASGSVTREIGFDSFLFRDGKPTALIHLHNEERILVIAASPDDVGQQVERVEARGHRVMVMVNPSLLEVGVISDKDAHYLLSYTGRIRVQLEPVPVARVQ